MTDTGLIIYNFTLSFYLAASLLFFLDFKDRQKGIFPYANTILKAALLSLFLLLFVRFIAYGYLPVFTFFETLLLLTLSATLALFILETYHPRFRRVFFFVMPLITFFLFIAGFFAQEGIQLLPELKSIWLLLHILTVIPAYGVLSLSFMASLMYLVVDYYLKKKKSVAVLGRLPSLEILDNFNYFLVSVGFFLLTVSIILGAFWGERVWGSFWRWEPKETWTLVTWLVYAVYLHARLMSGWRGKSIAFLNILGFGSILFNYIIVRFFISSGMHTFF